jgi:hypothetical protein
MVPVATVITGITSVVTFHMRCIVSVMSWYFKIVIIMIMMAATNE